MIFDVAMVATVFFAAFAWGANEPWAMGVIAMAALVTMAVQLMLHVWQGTLKIQRIYIFTPLILFLAWCFYAKSVESHSTSIYLLLAASYLSIVFVTAHGERSHRLLKLLLISIVILGGFEAVYGLVQYLGNYDYIWQFNKTSYLGLATGTLINRNHYALLLNLCICLSLGYLYYRSMRLAKEEEVSLRHVLKAPGAAQLVWIALWVAAMGLALVFSMSRMGIVAMFCSIGAMMVASKTSRVGGRARVIGLLLILTILGLAIYIGVDEVLARYENLSKERETDKDRIALWQDAWKMIGKTPIFGQGLGTFQWTYPAYESVDPDTPAKYAHNDYLQALAEVGVVGLALLFWAFGATWREAVRNLRYGRDPLVRGIGLGLIGALTAIALQEITDFGLYTPGVAATAAFLVGLNLRASALREEST